MNRLFPKPRCVYANSFRALNEEVLLQELQKRNPFNHDKGVDFLNQASDRLAVSDPLRYDAVIAILQQLADGTISNDDADMAMKKLFIRNWSLYSNFALTIIPKVKESLCYLEHLKEKFKNTPQLYEEYLEIFKTYRRREIDIKGCYDQVATLFENHPDEWERFKQYLPLGADLRLSQGEGFNPANPDSIGANSIVTINY